MNLTHHHTASDRWDEMGSSCASPAGHHKHRQKRMRHIGSDRDELHSVLFYRRIALAFVFGDLIIPFTSQMAFTTSHHNRLTTQRLAGTRACSHIQRSNSLVFVSESVSCFDLVQQVQARF